MIRFEAQVCAIDDTVLARLTDGASAALPSRGQVSVHATLDGHPFDKALGLAPARIRDVWEDITPMARWVWVRWVGATASGKLRQPS